MQKTRGSLPDLRHDCYCPRRYCGRNAMYRLHESSGSTDSLLDEAEEFLRQDSSGNLTKRTSRRCSEADVQRGLFQTLKNYKLTNENFLMIIFCRFSSFKTFTAFPSKVAKMSENWSTC
jgi:hypothetical protein